ncbi:hypothetical protein TRIUR3_08881 [Triticum urartu]|uniref:Uncharacterized protein n=1 Tax=Triticum urartu TaxID=4572 RepID=M7ZIF0_TRIUA|nr:hypothetical protein TRIUR3_08881 [Triticum urartu]
MWSYQVIQCIKEIDLKQSGELWFVKGRNPILWNLISCSCVPKAPRLVDLQANLKVPLILELSLLAISAYIEFLEKESAEKALTLNGTSFMSRILKVVRKSSVEVPQQPGWSRGVRASPFASRLIRTAYPRPTFPGAMRGRLAIRGNARSFQWKRGAADSVDAGKPSQATPVTPGSQMEF